MESVVKAWHTLMFLSENAQVTLTEIAEQLSYPKTTTFRILQTFVNLQLVNYDDTGKTYSIDYRVLGLGYHVLRRSVLRRQASRYLFELANKSKLLACLGVLSGPMAITIDKVSLEVPLTARQDEVGAMVPAHVSSVGKAVLAHRSPGFIKQFVKTYPLTMLTSETITEEETFFSELRLIKERGYALNAREWRDDVTSVAMPIFNFEGEAIGAVALSREAQVHGAETDPNKPFVFREEHVRLLKQAAEQISFSCGYLSDEMVLDSARG